MDIKRGYLLAVDIQIDSQEDYNNELNLDLSNKITFFKKTYVVPDLFIKDEIVLKNLGMKWNETSFVKIPRDIHLLGKTWLKVTIPYFQMIEKLTSTTTTTINNANVNEMIYDNNETYLIIYNDVYYLIPTLFLELPDLSYNEFKFKFSEIKKYFIDLTSINISDDTDILFYSFNMNNFYVHDIIPTVLNLASNYDKLTLNKLLNGDDSYKKNLLTQNSFDNYITTIVEDNIINEYQNIKKFDSTIDSEYYNFMALEFDVLYNNKVDTTSDVYLVENYINTSNVNTVDSIDKIKQNTITKTSLVYEYIITDLNPSFEKTFTFYKKYATINTESMYEFTLTNDNLTSGTITDDYPIYKVNIASLNLPFTLTTSMSIKTANDLTITYTIDGTDNIFTIDDTSTTTSLEKIKIVVNTNNDTLNEPNINVTFPDTNNNAEWTNNLLINLGKLDYNKQLEVLLFYQFKKNYFSKESIINNEILTFSSSVESIKRFWIELKTIEDRFKERNETIGFNGDEWIDTVNDNYTNKYNYIMNIEQYPQDIFNVYCIMVNKLYDTLKEKYFEEYQFLKFFYNKIFSYMYQRYNNISKLYSFDDFKGLLFYYNVDLLYYINKDIIKHYLFELFYMESNIVYIPLEFEALKLEKNNITDYMNTGKTNINTSDYFHELKYQNIYYLSGYKYTLSTSGDANVIAIKKEYTNYIYYVSNFVEFQLELYNINAFINVTSYTMDDTNVYLTYDTSIYDRNDIINNSFYLFLHETFKLSIPVIYISEAGTLNYNNIIVYEKSTLTNMFLEYNKIYVELPSNIRIIMKYTIDNNTSVYECTYNTINKLIVGNIPIYYSDYDKIELLYYSLPITTVNINNSKCNRDIVETFPYIEIKKSEITEDALFTTGNSFTLKGLNISARVTTGPDPANIIYLYCYYSGDINYNDALGINILIFENSYLPNLYSYTSLNSQICETNDYMIQKPTILALKNTGDYMYLMLNVPKIKSSDAGGTSSFPGDHESFNVYIDNKTFIKIESLYSNQVLRDGLNLYSTYFDNFLLSDAKYIDSIKTIVNNEYNGIYEDIYASVVNVIENSQNDYIQSYTEIMDYIDSGFKFGKTLQNIATYAKKLNNYTLTSNLSTIKLNFNETELIDFDSNTSLAMGLYNFTNRNNNVFKTDNTIISALGYKYNDSVMKIINSPWHCYRPYIKINPLVISYLDRYSSYSINMLNNVENNTSSLEVVNNKNFTQDFNQEYQMKAKYYHLTSDTNKYNVTTNINSTAPFLPFIQPTLFDATINDKIINYEDNEGNITLYSNEELDPYKYKTVYKKTAYNNMNCYYNLIGAVSIIDNEINNNNTLPDYIITDNKTIISTTNYGYNKIFPEDFYGINYNCLELEIDINNNTYIMLDGLSYTFIFGNVYIYKFTADNDQPFDVTKEYYVLIENQVGYLTINNDNIITLFIGKNVLLNRGTIIYYDETVANALTKFNAVRNNNISVITKNTSYTSTLYTINSIYTYNSFLNNSLLNINTSTAVVLTPEPYIALQTYGYGIYKLFQYNDGNDRYIYLFYLEPYNNKIPSTLRYTNTINNTTKLSPININYSSISFVNPFNNIEQFNNPDSWFIFKNNDNEYEFQFKDIDTKIANDIANGNYLVYYNSSSTKPTIYKHPDRFNFSLVANDKNYNSIANIITSGTAFDLDISFNYYIPIYNNAGDYLGTFLVNSLSENKETIYLEPKNDYINTTIYYEVTNLVPTTKSGYRPIILTTIQPTINYKFDNTGIVAPVNNFIGDSLTYMDYDDYVAENANIRITNIIDSNDPTQYISETLTTTSPYITISKTTSGLNKIFAIYLLPNKNIPYDYYNMIEIFTAENEKIILWLYLQENTPTYQGLPYKIADTTNTIPLTEPMYYTNTTEWYVKKLAVGETAVFVDIDNKYYTSNVGNDYIKLVSDIVVDITVSSDSYYNFNEVLDTTNTLEIEASNEKYIKSLLNTWSYIKYIDNVNGLYIDDLTLQKFDYFMFISSDNKKYFNMRFANTDTGIQLFYNLDIELAEVYIYDYKPIFIKTDISYNIVNDVAYIYIDRSSIERNEIIRIGFAVIQVLRWSEYYNCYIGNLLYSDSYITQIQGYYSFGIFTNYLVKNYLLKNTQNDPYIFYRYLDYTPIIGEYYIKTNNLHQYDGVLNTTNYIFKLKDGCYIDVYYIGTDYYYDDTLVNLKALYTIMYNNEILVIDTLDSNKITFKVNPLVAPVSGTKVRMFVPFQPFEIIDVIITDKELDITFNGWIEIYILGALQLYEVENGVIITDDVIANDNYTIRTIQLEKMEANIKNDFNNSLQNIYNNSDISITLTLKAKKDDTFVYFQNSFDIYSGFTFNINSVYYQSIIINNTWYKIIDFDNNDDRIYINLLSTSSIISADQIYTIIFSAANVNDTYLLSNRQILRNSAKIEYPLMNNDSSITAVFKGDTNFNVFNFDATIHTNDKTLSAPVMYNLINLFNNNNYNLSIQYFYENYIPLNINTINYEYEQLDLSIMRTNKILLLEVTEDGSLFQHYIDINVNDYIITITNTNTFQNIKTSFFYLHNVIPCIITNYNKLLTLPPDYQIYRKINSYDRLFMKYKWRVDTNIVSVAPEFIDNKWKYQVTLDNYIMNTELFKQVQLYVNNSKCYLEIDEELNKFLYIDDYQDTFSYFYYYEQTSVSSIVPDDRTNKTEYTNMSLSTLDLIVDLNDNYKTKQINKLYLSKDDINNVLVFKDINNTNINFGDIDDTTYIGKTNLITYSTINSTNQYIINTTYTIMDTSSTAVLYNIMTDYILTSPIYIIIEPEISTTEPTMEYLISDEGISIQSIVNETKPWKDWTLITTRHNQDLEIYLNNYDLVYDGADFTTVTPSTTYFTNDEITNLKKTNGFMQYMYNNTDAQDILTELYLVEEYLLPKLINYLSQRYFWDNIVDIITKLVANYNGNFTWTITNNILCITDEFNLYPNNFELVTENGNQYYVRKNYLPKEYDINYNYDGGKLKVARDASSIDTNIGYFINSSSNYNLEGTNIDNIIQTLLTYSTRINKTKTSLPLYFKYMDSTKYYISKLYFELMNTNGYKLANLSTFNRELDLSTSQYYGKYYDYTFKERYFGINGFNHYIELTNNSDDIIYVKGNIINDLYSSIVNDDDINKLITNNIFNYTISFKNNNYKTDLIKSTNTYTIDIKDNYNHLVDPTIENVYINTNSLTFNTIEMVQPTIISILSSEPYIINQKTDYGLIFRISTTTTLTSDYTITSGVNTMKYISQNEDNTYNIALNTNYTNIKLYSSANYTTFTQIGISTTSIKYNYVIFENTIYKINFAETDLTTLLDRYNLPDYGLDFLLDVYYTFSFFTTIAKASIKVVIKTATISSNKTYITFSNNYNNQFIYININNVDYKIDTDVGGYYINTALTIKTNELYNVFKTFSYTPTTTNNEYLSDMIVDRDIKPISYNQTDLSLPMVFSIDNLTINKVEILTSNTVRLTYNIINTFESNGNTLYHNYRLNESIPYDISTVIPAEQYYYQVNNTYKMTITEPMVDTMTFNNDVIIATITKIENNIITFYLNNYYITDDLNNYNQKITKDYSLTVISYVETKMIANIPFNIVNANSVYKIVDENDNIYDATVVFDEYLIITTDAGIEGDTFILRQIVTDPSNNHTITQNENNKLYTITTTNDIKYLNNSNYFVPIIQTLDNNLKEFDAKYYYKFTYNNPFTFGEYIYVYYNNVYIKGLIIMKQDDFVIIGTNNYIPAQDNITIYSANLTENQLIDLQNNYYVYYKGEFVEYINSTTYKILLPMNSLYSYDKEQNTTTNKLVSLFSYTENNLTNNTYPLVGFNKVSDITTTTTTNTTNYLDIEWVENIGVKLFKSIELMIDDNIVEKINPNIYKIISYYFNTMFKRETLASLITLRTNPDNSQFYNLPIPFHFSMIENYLPVSSMNRSNIKIKFVLEKLENLISNKPSSNPTYTTSVTPSIDFNYAFLTVDNNILNKFRKTDLLITTFYHYQNFLLNKIKEYNHISLITRTIELFFITETKNNSNKYTTSTERDDWYIEYLSNNPNDAYIFDVIDAEISANSYRYQVLKNNLIIKNYSTRYAMYLDEKYLGYINENLNNTNLKFSNKLGILSLYFKNIYKDNTIYTYSSIIDKLNILVNGKDLLPELPATYHNQVIPYNKGYVLPDGYHMYGFNINSLASQPNGFVNMKKIRDFLIYSSQFDVSQEYLLKICAREYKILKIDNQLGKIL